MHRHGTLRYAPTPNVLYQTARTSLVAYRENQRVKNARGQAKEAGAEARHQGRSRATAFLTAHLRQAARTSDVLMAAIKGIKDGQRAKSVETQLVYQSEPDLLRAYAIAKTNGD